MSPVVVTLLASCGMAWTALGWYLRRGIVRTFCFTFAVAFTVPAAYGSAQILGWL
jgi:hypothetical protein